MRKLIVRTFLLVMGLAFSSSIVLAQRGGGHMGGSAGHGGMSAPHASASFHSGSGSSGPRTVGRVSAPARSFAGAGRQGYRPQARSPYRGGNGYADHRTGRQGDRRRRVGYGYAGLGGYPYGYGGYGYPLYGLNGGLDLDDNDPNDPNLQSYATDNGYAGGQDGQQQAYDGPYDDSYPDQGMGPEMARPPYMGSAAARSAYATGYDAGVAAQAQPKVALIFKDGHRQQIQNYIATRTRIIVHDTGADQTIPIATLDVAATLAANRAAGNDFALPGNAPPGQ